MKLEIAKCRCQHCNKGIEFPKESAGQIVECPHCKLETLLFIPQKSPRDEFAVLKTKSPVPLRVVVIVIAILALCFLVGIASREGSAGNEMSSAIVGAILGLLALVVAAVIYFIPALIAHQNKKKNASAIFMLNLLAGWTFIGWVVAIVWAVTKDD